MMKIMYMADYGCVHVHCTGKILRVTKNKKNEKAQCRPENTRHLTLTEPVENFQKKGLSMEKHANSGKEFIHVKKRRTDHSQALECLKNIHKKAGNQIIFDLEKCPPLHNPTQHSRGECCVNHSKQKLESHGKPEENTKISKTRSRIGVSLLE